MPRGFNKYFMVIFILIGDNSILGILEEYSFELIFFFSIKNANIYRLVQPLQLK